MSILAVAEGPLVNIAFFLGEPVRGATKNLQFAQLVRDLILLRELKEMNLPLFSFLNQREIAPIDRNQGLVAELDRIHAIFREIHVAAKHSLTAEQFNEISSQNETRTLSRYIQLNTADQQNQDHAVTVLANALRGRIPAIPNTPVEIRVWFANPANQRALLVIDALDMSLKGLKCIPKEIGKLVNLQILSLNHNQLTALPESFGDLAHLILLGLSNNQLTTLPETFGQLVNLQKLFLHHNQLTALPESFGKLVNLQILSLNHNQLTALPESFGDLAHLILLGLSNNQLTALPESFGKLVNLQKIFLDHNQLTTLPETFGNLVKLQDLHMQDNQLTTLPDSIGNLVSLRELTLYNNQLTTLPETFGNLVSLQRLYLFNNQLTSLPDSFRQLVNLQRLYLSCSQLRTLPDDSIKRFCREKREAQTLEQRVVVEGRIAARALASTPVTESWFDTILKMKLVDRVFAFLGYFLFAIITLFTSYWIDKGRYLIQVL